MSVTLDDLRRAVGRPPSQFSEEEARHAAVAVIVTPSLDLLFMRRAEFTGDPWSGHVSFPGGRIEPHDESPLHGAIREAHEEIGVDLSEAEHLGALDDAGTVPGLPRLIIHPHVFALRAEPDHRLNAEVAALHRVPLVSLLAGQGRSAFEYNHRGMRVTLPCVDFPEETMVERRLDVPATARLWGLTLGIVDDLLDRLDQRGTGLGR